jgi:hypothetical protein
VYNHNRQIKLINTFKEKACKVCGESQPHRLFWWPHHKMIRHYILRYGKKTSEYGKIKPLIKESTTICKNCESDINYAILTNDDWDPRWPKKF